VSTKTAKNENKPASALHKSNFSAATPSRKAYRSIVNSTAKKSYRADLRAEAIARASAVKRSQRGKQDKTYPVKLRGGRKRKAAAVADGE